MESAPIYPLIELATVLNNGDAVSTINQIAVAISSSPDHHEEARQLLETAIQDSTPENALEIIEDMLSVADVSLPLICASESDHFPFWLAYLLNMAKMVPEGVEEHPDPTTDSLLINNALHILSDAVLVPTVLSTELATHIIHQTIESINNGNEPAMKGVIPYICHLAARTLRQAVKLDIPLSISNVQTLAIAIRRTQLPPPSAPATLLAVTVSALLPQSHPLLQEYSTALAPPTLPRAAAIALMGSMLTVEASGMSTLPSSMFYPLVHRALGRGDRISEGVALWVTLGAKIAMDDPSPVLLGRFLSMAARSDPRVLLLLARHPHVRNYLGEMPPTPEEHMARVGLARVLVEGVEGMDVEEELREELSRYADEAFDPTKCGSTTATEGMA